MKKILTTLAIAVVLLSSCTISADQEEAQKMVDTFQEVEYKGHSYIVFAYHYGGTYTSFGGLTHNPDCEKCKEEKQDD